MSTEDNVECCLRFNPEPWDDKDLACKTLYWYYTTCPKCAKKYGKNYVVPLDQV